jgi:hypothetical protein
LGDEAAVWQEAMETPVEKGCEEWAEVQSRSVGELSWSGLLCISVCLLQD